ncbi:MvaI/BcnI family restriction endonuclease [Exiguobacterium artemiae]|uniref:MvaI/BcnI family restriction endonuclease n=1 Tax=Exiguobacterium artemiae TaxID=340145 RepID=UPI003CFF3F76
MNIFLNPELIEDVFCKSLASNDDSSRHGVLIPVFAYHLFPSFSGYDPLERVNHGTDITTLWPQCNGEERHSSWKHYHRYPERRMTRLDSGLLNGQTKGSLFVVGKYREENIYECVVIEPSHPDYKLIGERFMLDMDSDSLFTGAAIIPYLEFSGEKEPDSSLDELVALYDEVNGLGFVKTMRNGDTGVGYTFESLIGIDANSSKIPDFKGIEIKCSRSRRMKERRVSPGGKQTLFSLIPQWGELEGRRGLIEAYGRPDDAKGRISIYCTIKIVENTYGWSLEIDDEEMVIHVCHEGKRILYYDMRDLKSALENKHGESVFITAETRGVGEEEEFYYDSMVHCREVLFSEYIDMIKENLAGLDFAIHLKDGKVKDHGFLWRMDSKKYLLRLFRYVQEIR